MSKYMTMSKKRNYIYQVRDIMPMDPSSHELGTISSSQQDARNSAYNQQLLFGTNFNSRQMMPFDNFLSPQGSPLEDNQTLPPNDLRLNRSDTSTAPSSVNNIAWPTTRLGSTIIENNMRMREMEDLLAIENMRTAAALQQESAMVKSELTLRMRLAQEREEVQNAEAVLACQYAKTALARRLVMSQNYRFF